MGPSESRIGGRHGRVFAARLHRAVSQYVLHRPTKEQGYHRVQLGGASAQAADASFREAWRAVDAFRQLSEEEFADKPMLFQARCRFLATALDFYNKFLDQRRDDPAVQQELAETKQQVERIMGELSLLEKLGPLMLLDDSHVQDDLQLSAETRTQISAALDEELLGVEQPGNSGFTKVLTAFIDRLNPLLTAAQHTRLQQIAPQQRGPFAFKSPEVIAALSLTSDQLSDINRIIEEQRPDKLRGPGGPDFGGPGHDGPPPDFLDHGFGKKGRRNSRENGRNVGHRSSMIAALRTDQTVLAANCLRA